MARVKSKAVFPSYEIMRLIAEWKGIAAAAEKTSLTPERVKHHNSVMVLIAEKATPMFTAFAVFGGHRTPMKFAELCRARVPGWVAAMALDQVPQVFSIFAVHTCETLRQLQAKESRES